MIQKKLKTTQGSLLVTIPTQLNEITLGQLMAMQQKEHLSDLDAISILSGVALEQLQNVKSADELDVFAETVLSLSNQIKYLYNSDAIPGTVSFVVDGKEVAVEVIRNLSVEPAGAFMAARDIIAEEIAGHVAKHGEDGWQESFNPSLKACAQILGHYFYCRVTGKLYNEYAVEHFADTIKTMRVTEALPIAKHFFMSYPNLSKRRTSFWLRLLRCWRKKQGYRPLKSSSISIPLTPYQAATSPNGTLS